MSTIKKPAFDSPAQEAAWLKRVNEIAPWAWKSDPYLDGMTEEQFKYLRNLEEEKKP